MIVSTSEQQTKKHRPHNARVREIQDSYKKLESELRGIVANCTHQFVPEQEVLKKIQETEVGGVYNGGTTGEICDELNDVQFFLECLECGIQKKTSIACHCPKCGHKTEGSWGDYDDLAQHFGQQDFIYYAPWWIKCTNATCGFKAISQRWDQ